MKEVATIEFDDADTQDKSIAVIRSAAGVVGLALSQRSNGDIEVSLSTSSARKIIAALTQALSESEGSR